MQRRSELRARSKPARDERAGRERSRTFCGAGAEFGGRRLGSAHWGRGILGFNRGFAEGEPLGGVVARWGGEFSGRGVYEVDGFGPRGLPGDDDMTSTLRGRCARIDSLLPFLELPRHTGRRPLNKREPRRSAILSEGSGPPLPRGGPTSPLFAPSHPTTRSIFVVRAPAPCRAAAAARGLRRRCPATPPPQRKRTARALAERHAGQRRHARTPWIRIRRVFAAATAPDVAPRREQGGTAWLRGAHPRSARPPPPPSLPPPGRRRSTAGATADHRWPGVHVVAGPAMAARIWRSSRELQIRWSSRARHGARRSLREARRRHKDVACARRSPRACVCRAP
ncbi:hypothetical protein PVAP13_5NG610900 [Panicum virgatum]|uniref:Uncharacterized protein n=1 Tax=Panicum virgatum TaxID=38727 RepID=A0A8T0S8V0_PANVG|nr:hypothetical protein PVAP13_5NG610900 [Panicum virgatum]